VSTFFLIWQNPHSREWLPVARLDRVKNWFVFGYTRGALNAPNFHPFANLSERRAVYISDKLFPIFANRVFSEKRPEYALYARWAGHHDLHSTDPLMLMAQMGGVKATDNLQVYSVPERTEAGEYRTRFFSHGVSHLPTSSMTRVLELQPGERLYPMLDFQNQFDRDAVVLRTSDPSCLVGYCPKHLAPDFQKLSLHSRNAPMISVLQVNYDAPAQYRLLCEALSNWPSGFAPCEADDYQTVVAYDPTTIVSGHHQWVPRELASSSHS
jgi:hypothetical protein